MSGAGLLALTVWPAYIGFGTHPDEDLPTEKRFQIRWGTEDGFTVGHAHPVIDTGDYPCLLYFHAPTGPPSFSAQFQHPVHLTAGRQHIGPIVCVGDEITAQVN